MKKLIDNAILQMAKKYVFDFSRGLFSIARITGEAFKQILLIGAERKIVTRQYPDPVSGQTEDDYPEKIRGELFNDIPRCTGCGECEKICPTGCFKMKTAPMAGWDRNKILSFSINHSKCIFCGLCVRVCQPESLRHTKKQELVYLDLNESNWTYYSEGIKK